MEAKRDIFVCYNCATNYPGKLADPDWPHNCLADETLCYCISTDGKDCPDYVESCACTKCWGVNNTMNKLIEAVKEASVSVACLLDDVGDLMDDLSELREDIEHIQNQITIIENSYLKEKE